MTEDELRLAAWMDDDREPYGKLPDHAEGPWLPPDWPPQLHPALLEFRGRDAQLDVASYVAERYGSWPANLPPPVLDPTLPPDVIELRHDDGTVVARITGVGR